MTIATDNCGGTGIVQIQLMYKEVQQYSGMGTVDVSVQDGLSWHDIAWRQHSCVRYRRLFIGMVPACP